MKIRVLGCGGSFGSPLAWKRNGNIDINNKKNFRTRSSILISFKSTYILIDTSPDLRQQLYNAKCTNIDAVLYTHLHSDHVSGLPDMRAISLINNKIIPAYMPTEMQESVKSNYKYIFIIHYLYTIYKYDIHLFNYYQIYKLFNKITNNMINC